MSKDTIVIFSMTHCSHCKSLKKRLDEVSIPYMDINIDINPEIWESVVKQTNSNLVPTIFIKRDGSEDGPVYVPGRDYQTQDEIFDVLKNIGK